MVKNPKLANDLSIRSISKVADSNPTKYWIFLNVTVDWQNRLTAKTKVYAIKTMPRMNQ